MVKKYVPNYDIKSEPIVLSKVTSDILLKQEKPSDVLALYLFYYITSKWQDQRNAYCTTSYTAEGLKWSEVRVRKTKKVLINLGLIENVIKKDSSGKVIGHYIKVNFKWVKEEYLDHPVRKRGGGFGQGVVNNGTNTTLLLNEIQPNLKTNTKKKNIKKKKIVPDLFDKFWELYPKRKGASKAKALTSWNKLCSKSGKERPDWKVIKKAIKSQKKSDRWLNQPQYIPHHATWLNQSRWLDDADSLNEITSFEKDKDYTYHGGYKLTKETSKI